MVRCHSEDLTSFDSRRPHMREIADYRIKPSGTPSARRTKRRQNRPALRLV